MTASSSALGTLNFRDLLMHDILLAVLDKERFKHDLFPHLLSLNETLDSWAARAVSLNTDGTYTYHGKQWTRQNLELFFKNYWVNGSNEYSWHHHQHLINQLEALLME